MQAVVVISESQTESPPPILARTFSMRWVKKKTTSSQPQPLIAIVNHAVDISERPYPAPPSVTPQASAPMEAALNSVAAEPIMDKRIHDTGDPITASMLNTTNTDAMAGPIAEIMPLRKAFPQSFFVKPTISHFLTPSLT